MVRAVRTGAAVGRGAPLRDRRCGDNSARVTGACKCLAAGTQCHPVIYGYCYPFTFASISLATALQRRSG